ncbi:MAG: hypothetical protein JSS75_05675 [Bacteroidetes bacterium]|nr:hypothetical protein [Bacteroidota bacterium]
MRWLLVIVGESIALCAYLLGVRRDVVIGNLVRAFPHARDSWRQRTARASYRFLGRTFAEMMYLRFAPLRAIEQKTHVSNPELYHAALAEGRGLIVVAAHYANWEWLAFGGALQLQSNFAIVRKNIQTSFTERFLENMRLRPGNSLINSGDVRAMIRTIREGKCLALLADQAAPSESVRVDFLGIPTPTQQGPAWLALKTGARMLFAECQLGPGGKYTIHFHPILVEPEDTLESLTQKHVSILENIILQQPAPWVWQHKRWKYVQ